MLTLGPKLLPLEDGEQYRFVFDMNACIGCHSCEVACAEQNDLPVDVAWRRVGEVEGGQFPDTKRFSMSMACNHCLEPTCLQGCPTSAYVKLTTGVVQHHAEDCIGCQYCTWNCPYSVPVFHEARKIVSKCDMCTPRLEGGFTSACADACPTHAIGIEKVNIAAWRADHHEADGPNLPPSDITLSTTRIIAPIDLPLTTFAASHHSVHPEHPHWPLVVVTLLMQLATGTMAALVIAGTDRRASIAAFLTAAISLPVSLFHLGRPILAWKAIRGIRRSWLSREVVAFSLFAASSFAPVVQPSRTTALVATAFGVAGIYCSGRLYIVRGRPAWNTPLTIAAFAMSAVASGPLLAMVVSGPDGRLQAMAVSGIVGQLAVLATSAGRLRRREDREWRGSYTLLTVRFGGLLRIRVGLAVTGLIAVVLGAPALVALGLVSVGEVIGRYLFFVTVVPLNMPGSFSRPASR